jgi:hypothetical protein
MEQKGRRSITALSVISGEGVVAVRRPEPPAELTQEEAQEWHEIVNRLPADWFPRETHGVLKQYCRHLVNARRVAARIEVALSEPDGCSLEDYDRLLKMQEREGRALVACGRAMRLTQQTTYSKDKRKPVTIGSKPWEGK